MLSHCSQWMIQPIWFESMIQDHPFCNKVLKHFILNPYWKGIKSVSCYVSMNALRSNGNHNLTQSTSFIGGHSSVHRCLVSGLLRMQATKLCSLMLSRFMSLSAQNHKWYTGRSKIYGLVWRCYKESCMKWCKSREWLSFLLPPFSKAMLANHKMDHWGK